MSYSYGMDTITLTVNSEYNYIVRYDFDLLVCRVVVAHNKMSCSSDSF